MVKQHTLHGEAPVNQRSSWTALVRNAFGAGAETSALVPVDTSLPRTLPAADSERPAPRRATLSSTQNPRAARSTARGPRIRSSLCADPRASPRSLSPYGGAPRGTARAVCVAACNTSAIAPTLQLHVRPISARDVRLAPFVTLSYIRVRLAAGVTEKATTPAFGDTCECASCPRTWSPEVSAINATDASKETHDHTPRMLRTQGPPRPHEWPCGRGLRLVCARSCMLLRLSPVAAAHHEARVRVPVRAAVLPGCNADARTDLGTPRH
ncbi:hypothetical protein B0H17DRAFT_1336784 [Mycena rosella]|uniref:Uncharacterized protein n=1 Tax=Mycena rosella TaxID=1033263 RepID=A0AAD7CU64_MYCRO|nr:hypothetical protein B0H17DRAFT_1336784 [Mycena rosella]